jgi:aldehyde:ferredoxin oxidoreductase
VEGYKLLDIDLSTRTYQTEVIPAKAVEQYMGGRGLGSYLLFHSMAKGCDPLSPDNPLIFTAGLTQGLPTPFSAKLALNTRSPLTGRYLFSITSGALGHNLRRCGYLSLRIKGKLDRPHYVVIDDQGVAFCDASHIWGKNTRESQEIMTREAGGKKGDVAVIGPAGEELSPIAGIFNEGEYLRCFGRGGCGAVMGSKLLKGIVIMTEKKLAAASPEKYQEMRRQLLQKVKEESAWAEGRRAYGTGADMNIMNEHGIIPTNNWQGGVFAQVDKMCTVTQGWPRRNVSCGPYCPAPCAHLIRIGEGPYEGANCDGPEYETIYAFGSQCGCARFDALVAASQICDEYGIDTMSAGVTIGFAMECFERGLISLQDTEGINLRFGDDQAMIAMLGKIVRKEGIGKILAEGVCYASRQIPGSEGFAMHAKGLEFGGYECRGSWGQALQYAINARGGCHHGYGLPARVEHVKGMGTQLEGKGQMVKNAAIRRILCDSAMICTFAYPKIYNDESFAAMFSALIGKEITVAEVLKIGERIQNMERIYNAREGLTREDDQLPERLTKEPKPDGPGQGCVVPLEALKDDYYRAMGWDVATGLPGKEIYRQMNIEN